ncbi:Uncharacterised protein [uncultured archaeon]|nr:Uncharacterised protein [uncultured archaeon]
MGFTGLSRCIAALLLLLSVALAQMPDAGAASAFGSTNPLIQKIYARINPEELARANGSGALMRNLTLVVLGSNLDAPEKAFYESAKAGYPILSNATVATDSQETLALVQSGKYPLVIVLGGPAQNGIAGELLKANALNESEQIYGEVVVQYGQLENGSLVVMVSDKRGVSNAARESVKYSPLTALGVPPAYVPAAATGISAVLMAIAAVFRAAFENKFTDLGKRGKKYGEGAIRVLGVNVKELAAIAFGALILGIALSWQYLGPTPEFLLWLFIDGTIVLFSVIVHELTHRLFAYLFKLKVEYRIWPEGSLITLVSSYLGNAFSAQSFLLDEIPEDTPKWKVGVMRLSAPLVSNGIALAFALINAVVPNRVFQTIYAASAVFAMAEMLPINGLDGYDIKKWNSCVWLAAFLFIGACYAFVTFIL